VKEMSNSYPKYEKYEKYKESKKPGIGERIKGLYSDVKRVLKIANKPDRKEYMMTFKICIIGLVILGALSYVLQLIFQVLGDVLNWAS